MLKVSKHPTTEDEIKKKLNDKKSAIHVYPGRIYQESCWTYRTNIFYTTLCFHFLTLELNV